MQGPLLSWFPVSTGIQGFSGQLGAAFQGASKAQSGRTASQSEMELRCDSGAQSENKSDVLPQEETESMKAGCCGGDLAESLPGCLEGWGPQQHSRVQEDGRHGQTLSNQFQTSSFQNPQCS